VSAPGYLTRDILFTPYGDGRDTIRVLIWRDSLYGCIEGIVSDDSTKQPVEHGDVLVDGSSLRAPVRNGWFVLDGVRPGTRTVTVRIGGYNEVDTTVKVRAGKPTRCGFYLHAGWSEWE
jgi:hypothetical protein